ncbi:MAG: patatin-like phospholipase family protein, partial [Planctomycetota bacterium]
MISLFESWWTESVAAATQRSVVLTLGGGGARGLAHLGVMEAIDRSGLHVERILGVSMGSLMGALSAIHPDPRRATSEVLSLLDSPAFADQCHHLADLAQRVVSTRESGRDQNIKATPYPWLGDWYARMERMMRHGHQLSALMKGPAMLSSEIMEQAIAALVPDMAIEDTATPLSIVAVDLCSGHRVVLQRGSLRRAILASTAIPGFFSPVKWDGMLLCDLGILEAMPLEIAKSLATDLTIGVDVGSSLQHAENFHTAFDVIM